MAEQRPTSSRFRAAEVTLADGRRVPVIVDVALDRWVGFISHFGNHELAARFERDQLARLRFTWHPVTDDMVITERPSMPHEGSGS